MAAPSMGDEQSRAVERAAVRPRVARRAFRVGVIRHGIVLMTLLGPCRALEPPNAQRYG
jgi:hypothetical protein